MQESRVLSARIDHNPIQSDEETLKTDFLRGGDSRPFLGTTQSVHCRRWCQAGAKTP